MLVHRLLDAFFRTLDAVDAVRDRVDRALGREPRPDPWAVEWPPPAAPGNGATELRREEPVAAKPTSPKSPVAPKAPAAPKKAPSAAAPAVELVDGETKVEAPKKKAAAKKAAPKKASSAAAPKAKPAAKKASSKGRKGSVDRQGKDFDSPRARAVLEHVKSSSLGVVTEEAEHNGKKVLARVLWALRAAEDAGSEKGLTTADASALLHLAAGMEVFATNIGRACRDHSDLIAESEPDGRSKRYKLTDEGRAAAATVETRPL